MYGVYSLGGFALLSIAACVSVVGAFSIAAAAARSLGAGARAFWVMFLPVLVAAPWAWSIRAQMLALPLYTGLLWLLAAQARRPTRRVWLALPLLVVWANMHGSVALGALLVMLLGAYELVRSRGRTWAAKSRAHRARPARRARDPVRPGRDGPLLPPPARRSAVRRPRDRVATGRTGGHDAVLLRARGDRASPLVWLGRRRLTAFDMAVLALTFVGGVTAIRGIVWFALACMVFVPVAIGRRLESKSPGEPRRGLNIVVATGLTAALVVVARLALPPRRGVVRGLLAARSRRGRACGTQPGRPRVRARSLLRLDALQDPGAPRPDRLRHPLRALRRGLLRPAAGLQLRDRSRTGNPFADGYRIVIVDEHRRSHTDGLPRRARARASSTGTTRSRSSPDRPAELSARCAGRRPRLRARRPSATPGPRSSRRASWRTFTGRLWRSGRLGARHPRIVEVERRPTSDSPRTGTV